MVFSVCKTRLAACRFLAAEALRDIGLAVEDSARLVCNYIETYHSVLKQAAGMLASITHLLHVNNYTVCCHLCCQLCCHPMQHSFWHGAAVAMSKGEHDNLRPPA